jgi:hypothetical protein
MRGTGRVDALSARPCFGTRNVHGRRDGAGQLFGDIAGSHDGRSEGGNRKAQRHGQRRSQFAHLV